MNKEFYYILKLLKMRRIAVLNNLSLTDIDKKLQRLMKKEGYDS